VIARLERAQQQVREAYERVAARLDHTRGGRFVLDVVRGALTVLHHLRSEALAERAGALSYTTVLALVPLLALSLSVASAVGHDQLRDALRDFVFAFMAPGIRQSSLAELETFIDRATSGGVVSASGAALFVTALMLLRSIESAINRIWGAKESRTWPLRVAVYVTVLLFGPVLLGASLAVTHAIRDAIEQQGFALSRTALALAPFAAAVAGMTVLYKVAPNAEVRKRSAFAGALVAGLLFEVVKHGYVIYTHRYVHYSMIYGSLAAIPLFLVWVYLSWMVVLFGARLAYAVQNAGSWGYAALPQSDGARARLAARTLLAAAVEQAAGRPAPGIHTIARQSGADEAAVAESARLLRQAGLLDADAEGGLVPARRLEAITLAEVSAAVRSAGTDAAAALGQDPASRAIEALFAEAERAGDQSLARLDLEALAQPLLAAPADAAPAPRG
jgi:membrane protein